MTVPCTSYTPTDETNHLKSSIDRDYQRTATVTLENIEDGINYNLHLLIPYLTTVSSALFVSSTEEVLRIDSLLPATLINVNVVSVYVVMSDVVIIVVSKEITSLISNVAVKYQDTCGPA